MRSILEGSLWVCLLCVCASASAQDEGSAEPAGAAASMAAAGKTANVDPTTGAINYSVPLLSISDGPLTSAVTANYTSQGDMVYDAGGVIGYGWHLNVGGIITREVRGIPDDFYGGWLERAGVFDPNRAYDKSEALVGNRDAEPDIFSFQAGGYVGKFFFEHGTRAVKQIPESDCLILPQWKGAAATIDVDGFVVVTPDGMRYRFGGIVDIGGVNVQLSDLRQPRGTFRDWRNASHIDAGNLKHVYAESYNISSISDIHGNEIKFKYSNQYLYRKNFPTFSAQYQALCSRLVMPQLVGYQHR